MIRRLYKKGNRWIGEFECPKCHKPFKAFLGNIQKGNTKSCGCDSKRKPRDLVGQKFGRLTVLEYLYSDNNGPLWKCQCSCDNHTIISVYGKNLLRGTTKSCGCLQRERASQANFKDLTGQKFGKLTPLYTIGKYNSFYIWHCRCDCGNYTDVLSSNLLKGNTKSCGCIKSFGEELISQLLKKESIRFEYNKTFPSLINPYTGRHLYLDFYLSDYCCAIECDGEQHTKDSPSGYYTIDKLEAIKQRDKLKQQWCDKNNIKLYRINYPTNILLEEMEEKVYECLHTIQKSF